MSTTDVLIIGGGPAGLAAAVALGRSRRSVTLIDAGQPRNAPSPAAHNVLGQEGISPLELRDKGRAEAESYGVTLIDARVTQLTRTASGFEAHWSGGSVQARRVILAQGLRDRLPAIPGLAEGWGTTVLHCPYCHGWEARDSRIVILGTSPMSSHQALMFSQLSGQVTLLVHDPAAEPPEETAAMLDKAGVEVLRDVAVSIDSARAIVLASGEELACDYVVAAPAMEVDGSLYEQVGGELVDAPMNMGRIIPSSGKGRTPVDGVWVAGNGGDLQAMVVAAATQGVMAGADVNLDLIMEDCS